MRPGEGKAVRPGKLGQTWLKLQQPVINRRNLGIGEFRHALGPG
jgi:hypothetical protein